MKQVILFGDSIRIGYQDAVRQLLAGAAEVWSPAENCGHSVNLLTNLHGWLRGRRADVIHVNAGFHDLKTVTYADRQNLVPPEFYRHTVATLLRVLRQTTGATLIWATCTPVRDALAHQAHAAAGDFKRYDADVVAYNEAARHVCREIDVPVNDLYGLARRGPLDAIQTSDGVHFTLDGYRRLGGEVAAVIKEYL